MDDYLQLEQHYSQQFHALFALVEAKHPEKGIQKLIAAARKQALQTGISFAEALEAEYQAAYTRTHRRLALVSSCQTPHPPAL